MEDIFAYAAKCVENKSVLARIGHSAKLHSVRSAVSSKGSAASKFGALVGAGARATLNAIPIPVVGSLLGAWARRRLDSVVPLMVVHNASNLVIPLASLWLPSTR